jgi:hypothetical protein
MVYCLTKDAGFPTAFFSVQNSYGIQCAREDIVAFMATGRKRSSQRQVFRNPPMFISVIFRYHPNLTKNVESIRGKFFALE